jgi:hypothetical protein
LSYTAPPPRGPVGAPGHPPMLSPVPGGGGGGSEDRV